MSTTAPMRNPSRMPFLTQPFTRQPLFAPVSGSAARTVPAFSAALNSWNRRKWSSVYVSGFSSKSLSISSRNAHSPVRNEAKRLEHFFDPGEILGLGRAHGKAVKRLEESHESHGGLYGDGIRFDEIDFHERQIFAL